MSGFVIIAGVFCILFILSYLMYLALPFIIMLLIIIILFKVLRSR
ncbi:hypothetical protein Gromo_00156 [Candidatus Gromoviella agglomerans]|nr:hypothetical protein Gromo_00156 [Candidatus Gromoviella agglomerans]